MTKSATGSWLARTLVETTGKQVQKPLGDLSIFPDHLRYDEAKKLAMQWFEHLGKGGTIAPITLRKACEQYVEHQRENKSENAANDAEARFARWIYPDSKLSNTELAKLNSVQVLEWRKKLKATPVNIGVGESQVQRKRSDASLNRDMTSLRAALNLAHESRQVTVDHAWRTALKPIENAGRRRDVYLDQVQRRRLIKHAQDDVANFLSGLSLLPLRPGALAVLTCADYDKKLKTLKIGKDKNGADRKIMLPPATASFLLKQMKGKLPSLPLLSRANGLAWRKDVWKYPIKEAALAAKLPATITAYAIRHSVITDLIHGGLDTLTTAQLSGTSVAMIEKHYGHLTAKHSKAALAKLKL